MISPGDVIKHSAAMDMAVQVVYANRMPNDDYEIRGIWFNMGQARSYLIDVSATFTIKKHQLRNWQKIIGPISDFIRDDEWGELQ